jgi:hypothetical protein
MIYQFKSIAVAIDFSNCSLRALDVAAAQAKRWVPNCICFMF